MPPAHHHGPSQATPSRIIAAPANPPRNHSMLPTFMRLGLHQQPHRRRAAGCPAPCLPDQAAALLRLKRSFTVTNYSAIAFRSWRAGTDCCRWMGVRCGYDDGRVTFLDLGDRGLKSGGLEPAVFYLTSIRYRNV
ncbi:unnamed protein product [Urochloa humidicola]